MYILLLFVMIFVPILEEKVSKRQFGSIAGDGPGYIVNSPHFILHSFFPLIALFHSGKTDHRCPFSHVESDGSSRMYDFCHITLMQFLRD
jgi:hypothetical protein